MTSITTRAGKGSPLTHNEVDANFTNLNNDKLDTAGIALGSAASPTLKFTGDPNTGIYSPGADQLAVATNGVGRLFVGSDGSVGVGNTGPGYALDISSADTTAGLGYAARIRANATAGAGAIQFTDSAVTAQLGFISFGTNGVGTIHADGASSHLAFATNATERARIDSSGRLLVGTSSALLTRNLSANGSANGPLQVVATSTGNANTLLATFQSLGLGHQLSFATSRGSTVGTPVQENDTLGRIAFFGDDGTDIISSGASILCAVDGTPGSDDMPGRLVFSTTADGAASPTERLRITSAGVLQIAEASNITVGTTTGTKIGTATTQKIGFYNATPVVQPTAVADATDAATVITQLNALLTRMRNLGLIAT